MFLRDSPMKEVLRFGSKEKPESKIHWIVEVLERDDPIAYRLTLMPNLSTVHTVSCVYASEIPL